MWFGIVIELVFDRYTSVFSFFITYRYWDCCSLPLPYQYLYLYCYQIVESYEYRYKYIGYYQVLVKLWNKLCYCKLCIESFIMWCGEKKAEQKCEFESYGKAAFFLQCLLFSVMIVNFGSLSSNWVLDALKACGKVAFVVIESCLQILINSQTCCQKIVPSCQWCVNAWEFVARQRPCLSNLLPHISNQTFIAARTPGCQRTCSGPWPQRPRPQGRLGPR